MQWPKRHGKRKEREKIERKKWKGSGRLDGREMMKWAVKKGERKSGSDDDFGGI